MMEEVTLFGSKYVTDNCRALIQHEIRFLKICYEFFSCLITSNEIRLM